MVCNQWFTDGLLLFIGDHSFQQINIILDLRQFVLVLDYDLAGKVQIPLTEDHHSFFCDLIEEFPLFF